MNDLRGREIKYKDGKRVLHQPVKDIIKCFDVTDLYLWVQYQDGPNGRQEVYFSNKKDNEPIR